MSTANETYERRRADTLRLAKALVAHIENDANDPTPPNWTAVADMNALRGELFDVVASRALLDPPEYMDAREDWEPIIAEIEEAVVAEYAPA